MRKRKCCPSCGARSEKNHAYGCSVHVYSEEEKNEHIKIRKTQMGLKRTVWERDRYICYYCRKDMKESYFQWRNGEIKRSECALTVDHIVPKSKGGTWEYNNLITACRACNYEKGSKRISAPLLRARIAIHNFVDFIFAKIEYIRHY